MEDVSVQCAEQLLRLMPGLRHVLGEAFRGMDDQHNLSVSQFMTLAAIVHGIEQPGELARQLRLSPPSVTSMLDLLVERGLVARERRPQDRRAVYLTATPEGARMVERSRAVAVQALAEVFAGLDDDRKARLLEALHDLGTCLRSSADREHDPAIEALAS